MVDKNSLYKSEQLKRKEDVRKKSGELKAEAKGLNFIIILFRRLKISVCL